MVSSEPAVWQERYSRQIRFAPIGLEGQRKLSQACVLIVGCGALGASLSQHMVRAGVKEVRLADRDFVELSNLQRQVLFEESDALAAMPKAIAAAEKLRRINSEVAIKPYVLDVNADTVRPLAAGADLVLDGTDNAATRLLLSDASFKLGVPFLYGGVAGSQGMSAMLVPGETACLRCIIGEGESGQEMDSCDTVGVLSAAVEFVTALQTAEAIKWLTGNREAMRRTWISADLWRFSLKESKLPRSRANCSHCGSQWHSIEDVEAGRAHGMPVVLCGRDTVQVTLNRPLELVQAQQALRQLGCELTVNRYLVKAALPSGEKLVLFPDGRVLVQGTSDTARAIELCSMYLQVLEERSK